MWQQRTLVIFKPDALKRKLVGQIIQRFEDKELSIVQLQMCTIKRGILEVHYREHTGKPFFHNLIDFMMSGPSIVAGVEGHLAIEVVRKMVGDTNGVKAEPGTIRGDLASGSILAENLIHASDSESSAYNEISLFFPGCVTLKDEP